MQQPENLLIVGASARAAAFSALRAGLRPLCADLFSDADLRKHSEVLRIPSDCYPQSCIAFIDRPIPGPWLYTGALENWPDLLVSMGKKRLLWGNDARAVGKARDPWKVHAFLTKPFKYSDVSLPTPQLAHADEPFCPGTSRWLVKPLRGASGRGIRFWNGQPIPQPRAHYFQEYIEGLPIAAIYVGNGAKTTLLGCTQQLIGEPWLHAKPFHYGGSIGPLHLEAEITDALTRLGVALAGRCELLGLFGVDCVLRDGVPWPVEINPRYTASVELLEYATGIPALTLHRAPFEDGPAPPLRRGPADPGPLLGKAILFAQNDVIFPQDGPWMATLQSSAPVTDMPAFADIPEPGQLIVAGMPILTFFARAKSESLCQDGLRQIAADLDHWLFGR